MGVLLHRTLSSFRARGRRSFVSEAAIFVAGNLLECAVFVNLKVVPGEARDVSTFRLFDADVEQDEVGFGRNFEFAACCGICAKTREGAIWRSDKSLMRNLCGVRPGVLRCKDFGRRRANTGAMERYEIVQLLA
jgi:hypothetical protein